MNKILLASSQKLDVPGSALRDTMLRLALHVLGRAAGTAVGLPEEHGVDAANAVSQSEVRALAARVILAGYSETAWSQVAREGF